MRKASSYVATVFFIALCLSGGRAYSQGGTPITIGFDNLASNTLVTNQYPQVRFSASGFSAGSGGPNGYDIYTKSVNFNNRIASISNPDLYSYSQHFWTGNVYLDFPVPLVT